MSKRIPRNDGYRRTPRDVAEALDAAVPVVDFLPDPETLRKEIKKPVTLRIDPDVISWFQNAGAGYQTRINAVLRAYMLAKRKG
ncbi:MAG: BrnA antitoxin family protein [Chloroflexi bacterium]|jgi:uncharacterized protein (DUF4415 family)|nr:BrnA antitoxin family protein [Chloroflexota bacterium]MBE3118425.1 BrnA antitoxin family protein [Candidatus Atribacteria bacterium]